MFCYTFVSTSAIKGTLKTRPLTDTQHFFATCCPHTLRFTQRIWWKRPRQLGLRISMGKVSDFGPFTPVVYVARWVLGKDRFNRIRGKAIALHSQVITEFCKYVGMDPKLRQGLIRLAKSNGSKLGFLS